MSCENDFHKKRLPKKFRDILNARYNRAPERNAWADFNCAWRAFKIFDRMTTPFNASLYCNSDIPNPPQIDDFTDLNKERDCTRE